MAKVNKFGTFGGVFTPSILTILGVIMFLRLPMIVGEAGLWATLGIIIVAHIISITTGLSVSSIATDKKVEAGGTYYMISRSLGLPIGGTLGLALFVGLSFSVSLYLIGFAESFLGFWGYEISITSIRIAGTAVLVVVTIITFISTSLAIKTQYFIMAAIGLSLVSIFAGSHDLAPVVAPTIEAASTALPFMVLFGIFFPAVTGFEAGVSMSGDLKDPKQSIPQGTIMAILVGLIVYIALVFFFASTVDRHLLASDPQVLLKISLVPELVIAGIWGATLSSALGSILGAPRILQATAVDKISPRFFARGVGASNEPRNALLLTFVIAEAGILIGELDVIARIVSIFFITTYGFLNLSCAFEAWTSADFRPNFKTPVWVSFLGAAACFIVMIQLDFVAMIGATLILGALFLFLKRKELTLETGDTWGSVWSSLAKSSLQRLFSSPEHNRNWRPNILMFNGADQSRPFMMKLGGAISGKLGMLSSFELVQSDAPLLIKPQSNVAEKTQGDKAFHYTYACTNAYAGIDEIARVYGFAGVEPNTVLMGWSKKPENREKFITLLGNLQRYNLNSVFLYHQVAGKKVVAPTVDIWWSGWGRNLAFALNLVRHLTSSDHWRRSNVRLCLILNTEEDGDRVTHYIRSVLQKYRMDVSIRIIDNHIANRSRVEIISTESADKDLTIIGIPDSHYDDLKTTYANGCDICDHLQSVLFLNASALFEEHEVIIQQEGKVAANKNEWLLPDLDESPNPEVHDDLKKIDTHGQELVEALHKKVFACAFEPESILYGQLQVLAGTASSTLTKSIQHTEPYQKLAVLVRAKKYFNAQVAKLIDSTLGSPIRAQQELLQTGIHWYLEQLEKDHDRFPKLKTIRYPREAFTRRKEDVPSLRWYKFRQRVLHPFSRKTIAITVHYRRGAAYFFRDSRYHFLALLLADLEKNAASSMDNLRQYVSWVDDSFQTIINASDPVKQDEATKNFAAQLMEKSEALGSVTRQLKSLYKGRLQVEYRKNVNFFLHQLERIQFDRIINRKTRAASFYTAKKATIARFSDSWSERADLYLNTVKTSAILLDYFATVETGTQNSRNRIRQFFNKDQQQPVARLTAAMAQVASAPLQSKQQTLPEWEFDYGFASKVLRETTEQLLMTAAKLPEEVTVAVKIVPESEGLTLPLRAMVSHLMEATLSGPINDKLEILLEKVRRSNLIISDKASLAMFTIFNLKESDEGALRDEEVKKAIRSIHREMETLDALFEEVLDDIQEQSAALKEALKLSSLADMAGDFASLIRRRRKKQLQSRVSEAFSTLADQIRHFFVSILYSEAKGILLARQLSEQVRTISVNERIIHAVVSTTPNPRIILDLPHYYVSLFSGRSSIGDNFWVSRVEEEKQFESAFQRYLVSRQGAILVLGERNSGKTSLCRHLGEKKSGNHTVYHVFPPEDGSTSLEQFEASLAKATRFEGDSGQTMNLLPSESIIMIHDVELWWERSEETGLTVIRHLKSLIEEHASKCLFILNMNPFAYAVINVAESLDSHCAGVVRCLPFNSLELKQLIMSRHQSSGLALRIDSKQSETIGQIRQARLFNKLFAYSQGNPGIAMNAWLTGIKAFSNKTVAWSDPRIRDEDVFAELPERWSHLCLQLLLHKRMSLDKIMRCVQLEEDQIIKTLDVMKRLQLVVVRGPSIYSLNQNVSFLLINHFRKREWI